LKETLRHCFLARPSARGETAKRYPHRTIGSIDSRGFPSPRSLDTRAFSFGTSARESLANRARDVDPLFDRGFAIACADAFRDARARARYDPRVERMLDADLERIAAIDHADPHVVLGPHRAEGGVVVRALRPDAIAIDVVPDDPKLRRVSMRRVHPLGVFEALVPEATLPLSYRLEVRYAEGTFTIRDAYAFPPSLGDLDIHLVSEGTHLEAWRKLGAHPRVMNGIPGTAFAVWAPNARRVSVAGDFNSWDGRLHAMRRLGHGIWEIFIPEVGVGALYKYEVKTSEGLIALKSDPYAQAAELRPRTASKVVASTYRFTDDRWIAARAESDARREPIAIYECHLGSWRRTDRETPVPDEPDASPRRWLTYRELADQLVDYVADLGFSHIELLPIMEHPFDGSWGYQVSGYFAPTSRYGSPDDFRYFVDRCHARGIGVILDWAPAHFPKDAFALGRFDGTALYEHIDPRRGEHKHWGTYIFNYGRPEVRNFLVSSALYWLEEFHVDGLRVDAVASMLYLDYSAEGPGDWIPNEFGGRENLEAVAFLRELCDRVHTRFPGALLMAEESTTWSGVTRPTYVGGLGFDLKWNMGWMHDTLDYFALDPFFRSFNHRLLTFGLMYAFSERFLLPLSHDEVVHLKKSLLSKLPGDRWQMHANLRALYAYMWAHPGKKLLFMGGEIGQWAEWNFAGELDWPLLDEADHAGLHRLVRDINTAYREQPALYELDDEPRGFRWIDANDSAQSVASFIRYPSARSEIAAGSGSSAVETKASPPHVVFIGNFTPLPRYRYRIGVPFRGTYRERLNTDAKEYGGGGVGNLGKVEAQDIPSHGFEQSIELTLPPLGCLWLVPEVSDDEPNPTLTA
jgi:1,4-alpha-glucan branching enzyme